ncbi:Serine/threonine protein kinase [Spraguea lophii 42_110]|uniref:protein kinase C n=1 Tax=Spraguea lophii (strain 42_110) TaxID=1358809 RepID=S7XJH3_SPRLO|nr:Serine/threonine protein kinase [Spraguea lophii 42_110]
MNQCLIYKYKIFVYGEHMVDNTADLKMLKSLKALVSKLDGKQKESAEYRIRELEKKIENEKCNKIDTISLNELVTKDELEQKIAKEYKIIDGYEKMMKIDKTLEESLLNKKILSEKKITLLKTEMKNLKPSEKAEEEKETKRFSKTSGTVRINISSFVSDPLYECHSIAIYLDSILKETIPSTFRGEKQLTLENNAEIEIILIGVDDVLLGMLFLPCEYFINYKVEKQLNFNFSGSASLYSSVQFQRELKLLRKNAEIICVFKEGHTLENFYSISPYYCCVCDNLASLFREAYRCGKCKFTCHKKCANFILFNCLCTAVANVKEATKRYNIPHKLVEGRGSGLRFCGHCGSRIKSGEASVECNKCKKNYHKECSSMLFNSCGIEYDLRKGMAAFKPPLLETKEEDKEITVDLNSFSLVKVLGRGSFGKVMLAHHKIDKTVVAIKILKKEMVVNANNIMYLELERKVLKQVSTANHPFLMQMKYCFQDPQNVYFGTEFLSGGDLFYHALQGEFSLNRVKQYACEILLGIGYLHSQNIVYRDLKLDNVLLDNDGHVKIADFGLCKENVGPHTITYTLCGTPDTLAPEVISEKGYTKDCDWWSYGVVLYELSQNEPPFNGATTKELTSNIMKGEIEFNAKIEDDLKDLILKLLERDYKKRLGTGEADYKSIQQLPYFADVNWDDVSNRKLKPEFVPGGGTDCFDEEFTDEPIIVTPSSSLREYDKYFANFH